MTTLLRSASLPILLRRVEQQSALRQRLAGQAVSIAIEPVDIVCRAAAGFKEGLRFSAAAEVVAVEAVRFGWQKRAKNHGKADAVGARHANGRLQADPGHRSWTAHPLLLNRSRYVCSANPVLREISWRFGHSEPV
jgi:hypothetical protein